MPNFSRLSVSTLFVQGWEWKVEYSLSISTMYYSRQYMCNYGCQWAAVASLFCRILASSTFVNVYSSSVCPFLRRIRSVCTALSVVIFCTLFLSMSYFTIQYFIYNTYRYLNFYRFDKYRLSSALYLQAVFARFDY